MASSCNIDDRDTNSAKKRKSSANEDSCKYQKGVNTVDLRECRKVPLSYIFYLFLFMPLNYPSYLRAFSKHAVSVELRFADAHSSSDEDLKSVFASLMKDAGCSESQMSSHGAYCFFAYLTDEQAKKLSGVNHVKRVAPCISCYCIGSVEVNRRVS